ncbi:2-polyprenyl-3-methyl-5-hydroxy-6-metoxy-1,4-benzoquinol methylase [Geodermatophilus pulveris]|uniref:2-polyprenyl-3-methyl-5-hydroxy-6-metoxy-1,4-benzoquinol methylase n=1 Tax=Geodermatophilus pulveris TaxID=1564159 RepID=A0A239FFJ7_9ACTN|nr:class I SAM-dependent methyltransferase [Geodermatophilus pulveris]SNS55800.1 2-polyprenyl-3-methyl-5-hydroxy-6-metoxy-1,4-benzoquinol methylase [Geodermatophilus pulveris]
MTTTETSPADATTALAERLLEAVTAGLELAAVHLGSELGWYRALAEAPATAPELAARTDTGPRYAREWLEQQAVAGFLGVDDAAAGPDERRYALPEAHRAVLVDRDDLAYMPPFVHAALVFARNVPRLLEVYRTGGGLSWAEMGEARDAQADCNRAYFLGPLAGQDLASVPAIDAALRAGGRVADVGCGMGWSSIGIARAYPQARVDGYDVDEPSIEQARRNAEEAGVAARVRFTAADAAAAGEDGSHDLVAAFECVHDLADPVAVLAAMRRMVRPGGTVLVVDEKVAERFAPPGDAVERLMYGYSVTCCLPDGLSTRPSAGTGTVMRPATLERYAREAGFAGIEVLPVEHDTFRFYRLVTGG